MSSCPISQTLTQGTSSLLVGQSSYPLSNIIILLYLVFFQYSLVPIFTKIIYTQSRGVNLNAQENPLCPHPLNIISLHACICADFKVHVSMNLLDIYSFSLQVSWISTALILLRQQHGEDNWRYIAICQLHANLILILHIGPVDSISSQISLSLILFSDNPYRWIACHQLIHMQCVLKIYIIMMPHVLCSNRYVHYLMYTRSLLRSTKQQQLW